MVTETEIREALRVCYDPELRINIVDLGRVSTISVEDDNETPGSVARVRITVGLLPRDEELDAMLTAQIINRLHGLREVSQAEVVLASAPAWTPDRMNAAAKRELGRQRGLIQLG